ncbi:MAG: hypothetical protein NTW28_12990 [Candidatus Solibacter sp.]|nr:hypothetical protein [Candidatus Solibacter sp.]
MKRNLVVTGLLILLAGLASAADLTGKWEGSFKYNEQVVPVNIELKGTAEISGTVTGLPGGVAQIKDGKLEGESLSFWIEIDYQGNPLKLVYKGKVNGNEIRFMFGTEDGSWGTDLVAKKA